MGGRLGQHPLGLTPGQASGSHLEVVTNVLHATLDEQFPRLLFQWGAPYVQLVHISQVVDAAHIQPVPGRDLGV